jgi:hypothetical protein
MDGDNRLCLSGNGLVYPICVQIQRVWIAINKHWFGPKVCHYFCGCRESHRRNKDFVSFLKAGSFESQMEGSRTRIYRDSISGAHHHGKFTLEISRLRAGGQPPRPQNIKDFRNLFFAYIRHMEWKHSVIR